METHLTLVGYESHICDTNQMDHLHKIPHSYAVSLPY